MVQKYKQLIISAIFVAICRVIFGVSSNKQTRSKRMLELIVNCFVNKYLFFFPISNLKGK